jgi:hypothetical protein
MADLADVETALVDAIAAALYPNGTGQASSIGASTKVFRGSPVESRLDSDLASGIVNVSVFPAEHEENTTRYPTEWHSLPLPAATLTATVDPAQTQVTIGGTVSVPQNVGLLVTAGGRAKGYAYGVQPGDTLATIAAALAALVNTDTPASAAGPVVTIAGARAIAARIGVVGTAIREVARQRRSFEVTIWSPGPALRDATGAVLRAALAATAFLSLADGTAGRLVFERERVDDVPSKELLFRRDIVVSVEYGTTETRSWPQIILFEEQLTGGETPPAAPTANLFL